MIEDEKTAAEAALSEGLAALQDVCEKFGITTKRATELLAQSHIKEMENKGYSQVDIVARSGYSVKTIQKFKSANLVDDETSLPRKIGRAWASDHQLPSKLSMDIKTYPSIQDLTNRYGRDLTPHAVVRCLVAASLAEEHAGFLYRKSPPVIPTKVIEKLPIMGRSIRDLCKTVTSNLSASSKQEALPEVRIFTPFLKSESAEEARIALRDLSDDFHEQARIIIRRFEDPEKKKGREIGIGLYVFQNEL